MNANVSYSDKSHININELLILLISSLPQGRIYILTLYILSFLVSLSSLFSSLCLLFRDTREQLDKGLNTLFFLYVASWIFLLSLYVKEIGIIYEPLESLRHKDSAVKLKTLIINCRFKNIIKLERATGIVPKQSIHRLSILRVGT